MSLIGRFATQTLWYRRRVPGGSDYEGYDYTPDADDPPTPFSCVWEPGYHDPSRDAPETRRGRVLTTTELGLRDLVLTDPEADIGDGEAQEVTEVNPLYKFDGSLDFYEVFV